jgi:branched-chain amino acid transport system ATP-binding protein
MSEPNQPVPLLLEVRDLVVQRGTLEVLHGVSLDVAYGESVAVLGPNGAGKTSLLLAISGLLPSAKGDIAFADDAIRGMDPASIVSRGLVHVPEGRHLFPEMTVSDNVMLGAYARGRDGAEGRFKDLASRFPVLWSRRRQAAGSLSGGEQQIVAIARALMARPRLLLLDEPSIGLAPRIVGELGQVIKELIADYGCGLVLVEQNVGLALDVADRAYVLDLGHVSASGSAQSIAGDDRLAIAYLGDRPPDRPSAAKAAPA